MYESYRTAPIARLPEETLLDIFDELVIRPFSDVSSLSQAFLYDILRHSQWNNVLVSHVCRYWRHVALCSPKLWSCISQFNRKDVMEIFLDRSSVAPLSVFFLTPGRPCNIQLLKFALSQLSRIRILEIHCGGIYNTDTINELEALTPLLKHPAPLMEQMSVNIRSAIWHYVRWGEVFGGFAPKLTFLSIDIDHTNKQSLFSIAKGLFYLYLHYASFNLEVMLEITDVLGILAECPTLKELKLSSVLSPQEYLIDMQRKINLPLLEYLSISGVQYSACQNILALITFPARAVWSIDCYDYPIDDPVPFALQMSQSSNGLKCYAIAICRLDSYGKMVFKAHLAEGQSGFNGIGHELSLKFNRPGHATLRELARVYKQGFCLHSENILLDFEKENLSGLQDNQDNQDNPILSEGDWVDFLGMVPEARSLTIKFPSYRHCSMATQNFLAAMMVAARPGSDLGEGTECPKLPLLKELVLSFWHKYHSEDVDSDQLALQLIQCLKSRYENGLHLISLQVAKHISCSEENRTELERWVGNFVWEPYKEERRFRKYDRWKFLQMGD